MLRHALPLKFVLVAVGLGVTLATMVASTWIVERATSKVVAQQIGRTLAVLAHEIEDKLQIKLQERFEDILHAGSLVSRDQIADPEQARVIAQRVLTTPPGYPWVGIFAPDRSTIVAMGKSDLFEKSELDAALSAALKRVDHDASVFRLIPPKSGGGWHILVAAVIRGLSGEVNGIAAAIVNAEWVPGVLDLSKEGDFGDGETQIVVLSSDGHLISGPANHDREFPDFGAIDKTRPASNGSIIETSADGQTYVTGYARSDAGRFLGEREIIVLVKQRALTAQAALFDLRRNILLIIAFFTACAVVFHWWLASLIASPILKLATSADAIRRKEPAIIPHLNQFAEVATLSHNLGELVAELQRREASLSDLTATLELQVRDRTLALSDKNALLIATNQKAEAAVEAKSRLLAAASHDLRQPLHALSLYCHALKRRVSTPDTLRLSSQLEQSLASLSSMLDALLHIARLDAGLVSRSMIPVPLAPIIDLVGAEFAAHADEKGLRFNTLGADFSVVTDPALFETMLRNLISNAFKFTKSGGVLVGVRPHGSKVAVEVYDTGPGIAPERFTSIFQEFERSPTDATGSNAGLGLGLSIVERYAKLIGAQISVRSVPGRGSRFSIILPKAGPADRGAGTSTQTPADFSIEGLRILLVDDNASALDALTIELGDRGAKIKAFLTAGEAMGELAAGFDPHLAIVDFDLGTSKSGVDAVAEMRCAGFGFPAVMLTGRTDAQTLAIISNSGLAWMTKPADPVMLAQTIARLVPKRQSTEAGSG